MTDQADDLRRSAYDALTRTLLRDEHLDVEVARGGLHVRGRLFAFLDGAELVVRLPEARAAELQEREVATTFDVVEHTNRNWVRVSDWHLWPEMAREAHQYVGHPPLGGES
ncbi:hypothetical protein ACFFGH_25625 [Lysobacter korlensis]|uniref:TfoX N-terminal domain-containing protein n=1 Tax=Lysobacter korlensis TaxID=553636 RepID=A0ABV6RW63_9GAMM